MARIIPVRAYVVAMKWLPLPLLCFLFIQLANANDTRTVNPVLSVPPVTQQSYSLLAEQWVRAFNDLSTQNQIQIRAVRADKEIVYQDITALDSLGSLVRVTRSVPGNRTIRLYLRADDIIELTESFD